MEDQTDEAMTELKARIETGEYQVDPRAVADALLRHLADLRRARSEHVRVDDGRVQSVCSYPTSDPSESAKTMVGGPLRTRPIQLRLGARPWVPSASSALARAFGGTQTQSS